MVIVPDNSPLEAKLIEMTRNINGTFPMLEFEPGTLMCDSLAIAAFLARGTESESLLGADIEEQNQQLEWMGFLREKTFPIV